MLGGAKTAVFRVDALVPSRSICHFVCGAGLSLIPPPPLSVDGVGQAYVGCFLPGRVVFNEDISVDLTTTKNATKLAQLSIVIVVLGRLHTWHILFAVLPSVVVEMVARWW